MNIGTYLIENYFNPDPVTGQPVSRQRILYFSLSGDFELEEEFYSDVRPGYIQGSGSEV